MSTAEVFGEARAPSAADMDMAEDVVELPLAEEEDLEEPDQPKESPRASAWAGLGRGPRAFGSLVFAVRNKAGFFRRGVRAGAGAKPAGEEEDRPFIAGPSSDELAASVSPQASGDVSTTDGFSDGAGGEALGDMEVTSISGEGGERVSMLRRGRNAFKMLASAAGSKAVVVGSKLRFVSAVPVAATRGLASGAKMCELPAQTDQADVAHASRAAVDGSAGAAEAAALVASNPACLDARQAAMAQVVSDSFRAIQHSLVAEVCATSLQAKTSAKELWRQGPIKEFKQAFLPAGPHDGKTTAAAQKDLPEHVETQATSSPTPGAGGQLWTMVRRVVSGTASTRASSDGDDVDDSFSIGSHSGGSSEFDDVESDGLGDEPSVDPIEFGSAQLVI